MDIKTSFSTSEVAEYCHVTADTIRKWAEAGRIQVFKTPGGHRRIRREELIRFLREHKIPIHSDLTHGGFRILLADEEKSALGVIRRFLERSQKPFQIELADDAYEAGYRVAAFNPDIIFLGIRLAGLSGLEICRRIKASPEHRDIHIILLADSTDNVQSERVLECGASAFLRKPFTPDDMRKTLAHVGMEIS